MSIQKYLQFIYNEKVTCREAVRLSLYGETPCSATHLLMNGINIREIPTLLGHQNVETTMIYTHVMRDMTTAPKSPLDLLLCGSPKSAESGDA
jgi:integrase